MEAAVWYQYNLSYILCDIWCINMIKSWGGVIHFEEHTSIEKKSYHDWWFERSRERERGLDKLCKDSDKHIVLNQWNIGRQGVDGTVEKQAEKQ